MMVAQVDEQQATQIAHGMRETHQANGLADGGGIEFTAGVAPKRVHGPFPLYRFEI